MPWRNLMSRGKPGIFFALHRVPTWLPCFFLLYKTKIHTKFLPIFVKKYTKFLPIFNKKYTKFPPISRKYTIFQKFYPQLYPYPPFT